LNELALSREKLSSLTDEELNSLPFVQDRLDEAIRAICRG